MRVFISWSGEPSRLVGEALRDWLPTVIQAVKPWMSAKDIDKGARWSSDIADELDKADIGILCLTPGNLDSPWILFEAGALSKKLGKSLVCPYLFGVQPTDLEGPLVQFQAATATEQDTFTLLETVNRALGESALPAGTIDKVFKKWWPELAQQLAAINLESAEKNVRRSERDILEETLSLVRLLAKSLPRYGLSVGPTLSYSKDINAAIALLSHDLGHQDSPGGQQLDAHWRNLLRRTMVNELKRNLEKEHAEPASDQTSPRSFNDPSDIA